MNIDEALSKIHAPKGITSMLAGALSGDFDPIRGPDLITKNLDVAKGKLAEVIESQSNCRSDWAFWGYEGDKAYWSAVVNILEAAAIVGADNLPDVTGPEVGCVVMDQCSYITKFGKDILAAAKAKRKEATS